MPGPARLPGTRASCPARDQRVSGTLPRRVLAQIIGREAVVVQVGTTQLRYRLRCVDDLHAMLKERSNRMRAR